MVTRLSFAGVIARVFMWTFLLCLVVVVIYPLMWMVLNGFKTNAELFGNPFALPVQWGWENYSDAWNRGVSNYLTTSILVTVTSTIATVFISAWAAYGLTRVEHPVLAHVGHRHPGRPHARADRGARATREDVPGMGLYNTFWALLILYTAFRIPFTTFLIRAYMIDLPREVDEAAEVDGAAAGRRSGASSCRCAGRSSSRWSSCTSSSPGTSTCSRWSSSSGTDMQTLPVGLTSLMSKHGTD